MFQSLKKYIFITTPNKYFPIDFHTKIPLLNMLPKKIFRFILRFGEDDFFSKEENLNLMSETDTNRIMKELNIVSYKIYKIKFLVSQLILY